MAKSQMHMRLPGCEVVLSLEQDWITPQFMVQPTKFDPDWRWTDKAGHKHDAKLSKAVWKVVYTYYCEACRDEHEESDLVCRYCGEKIEPKRVPDYDALKPMPGLLTALLDVKRGQLRSTYLVPPDLLKEFDGELTPAWVGKVEDDGRLLTREIVSAHG